MGGVDMGLMGRRGAWVLVLSLEEGKTKTKLNKKKRKERDEEGDHGNLEAAIQATKKERAHRPEKPLDEKQTPTATAH